MMFSSLNVVVCLTTFAALFSEASAVYWKGFSMGANTASGACKSRADWEADFERIKSWNQGFNAIRTFASSDCGTLANAVPAAQKYGIKIMAGVWATDINHFNAEKAALQSAIQAYGTKWIAGIIVGSEDLYRGDISPQQLANQIYDVRGMVRQFDSKLRVAHGDTWTAWVNPANDVVTRACDFVVHHSYPYWEGANIDVASATFFRALDATKARVKAINPGAKVMVGETGWSSVGAKYGSAIPNKANAQKYWSTVACTLFKQADVFWFTAFDAPTAQPKVEQGFGVAYYTRQLKLNLKC